MIELPETPGALLWIGDRRVLVGRCTIQCHGHHDDGRSASGQHPIKLMHRFSVVRHMFQHMRAKDQVEGRVREGHRGDVKVHGTLHVGVARGELVAGGVVYAGQVGDTLTQAWLRRHMKNAHVGTKQPVFAQIEPGHPGALARSAEWTQHMGPWRGARGKEGDGALLTDRAIDRIPAQRNTPDGHAEGCRQETQDRWGHERMAADRSGQS